MICSNTGSPFGILLETFAGCGFCFSSSFGFLCGDLPICCSYTLLKRFVSLSLSLGRHDDFFVSSVDLLCYLVLMLHSVVKTYCFKCLSASIGRSG